MDLSQRGSGSEEMNNKSMRSCTDCQTTKTPLWRGGPAGPKSLCNACGIRQRKKRRAILGIKKGMMVTEKKERSSSSGNSKNGGVSLKVRFHTLGREVLLQRSLMEKQRNLGEEEQAAVLLMALSCGAVCV